MAKKKKQSMFYAEVPKAGEYPTLLEQNKKLRKKILEGYK